MAFLTSIIPKVSTLLAFQKALNKPAIHVNNEEGKSLIYAEP